MQKNYYQILRIKNDATVEQINEAYYRACDRVAQSGIDDPETRTLLNDAYESLIDPGSRAAYDESLQAPPAPPPRLRTPPPPDFSMETADIGQSDHSGDSAARRRTIGIAIAIGAALLTVFMGFMFMGGKSGVPTAKTESRAVTNTSTIPVSSEPLSSAQPAPATTTPVNPSAPRTGDQVFAEVSNSIVRIIVLDDSHVPIGGGSGVVTARNTVITNCHVALKGPLVEVRTGKDSFPATVALADETYDLCQLSVGGGFNAPPVEIGNMQYVRQGQKVFAIGAPQGLELTISEGIVSGLREMRLGKIIQTSAAISPGSSGGGLFNISGQLIGITTFQLRTGQNLNFAVPADWIADMNPRGGPGPSLE